jgi:addiction module HigA family antidote
MEHLEHWNLWNSFVGTASLKQSRWNAKEVDEMHPGRIILEEFLAPRGISVFRLAKEIDVSPRRIYEIVQGQRSISADIAHRLAHYFGMSERYWLDLQARYDGRREDRFSKEFPIKQSIRYAG